MGMLEDPTCHEWNRNGDWCKDQLELFKKGYFYDCTISVGEENATVFKCHKLILARASKVFAKIFYGHFKEASHDKDTPIRLSYISPAAFSIAMKYVYGNVYHNKSVSLACEVYQFAHFYQIGGLMKIVYGKLKNPTVKEVIPIYELSTFLKIEDDSRKYREMISSNTSEILKSPQFIKASPSTLVDIFSMNKLKILSEMELFHALVNWASLNASKKDGGSSTRELVDEALKQIRFFSLKGDEFSELCSKTDLLSNEEKLKILMSINLCDAKYMPDGFTVNTQFRDVKSHMILDFTESIPCSNETQVSVETPQHNFRFLVRGSDLKYLSSIRLFCLLDKNVGRTVDVTCSMWSTVPEEPLAVAKFNGVVGVDSQDQDVHFPRPYPLKSGVPYTITTTYHHKQPVHSKVFKNVINKTIWEFPQSDFQLFKSGNIGSHRDIINLHFITRQKEETNFKHPRKNQSFSNL